MSVTHSALIFTNLNKDNAEGAAKIVQAHLLEKDGGVTFLAFKGTSLNCLISALMR